MSIFAELRANRLVINVGVRFDMLVDILLGDAGELVSLAW